MSREVGSAQKLTRKLRPRRRIKMFYYYVGAFNPAIFTTLQFRGFKMESEKTTAFLNLGNRKLRGEKFQKPLSADAKKAKAQNYFAAFFEETLL